MVFSSGSESYQEIGGIDLRFLMVTPIEYRMGQLENSLYIYRLSHFYFKTNYANVTVTYTDKRKGS